MISIVIPTQTGREESLERALTAYEQTLEGWEWQLVLVKDAPSWSRGCNEGYLQAEHDIIQFGADDLEAQPRWFEEAYALLEERDELPAAKVLNHSADGFFDNWADGKDQEIVHFSRIPLMRRDQYERIGPWPAVDYASDIWVGEKAFSLGIRTRMLFSYCFVHHWSQIKRTDTPTRLQAAERELKRLRAEIKGNLPA